MDWEGEGGQSVGCELNTLSPPLFSPSSSPDNDDIDRTDGNANFDDQVFLCSNDKDDNDCGFDGNFNHLCSRPVENCQI